MEGIFAAGSFNASVGLYDERLNVAFALLKDFMAGIIQVFFIY